jgi:O-antigen/teichoic acid export membrane protein
MAPEISADRRRRLDRLQPMRHSVIRRSLYTGTFFVAGHGFYYLLVIAANAKLDPAGFGRFYLGWAILNILAAPGGVLALSLSSHFADAFRRRGSAGATTALGQVAARLMPWTLALLAATELSLLVGGRALGADSIVMIILLPLTALTSVMVETVRAVFQGMLRFLWFGASWLTWCIAQFALGAAGLAFVGAPWAVFLGMLAANCAMLAVLVVAVGRMEGSAAAANSGMAPGPDPMARPLTDVLPFCVALGGFVLLSNADVLVAYLTLTSAGLGAYSASAILPKAIVTATHAVSQVILPVATHIRGAGSSIREALIKAVSLTFALAALGAFALWLVSDAACGGRFGIKFCDPTILLLLAGAAIAVSVIRTSVVVDVIGGRRWRATLLIVASVGFAAACWLVRPDGARLALAYSLLCWLLLGISALLKLIDRLRGGRAPVALGEAPRS